MGSRKPRRGKRYKPKLPLVCVPTQQQPQQQHQQQPVVLQRPNTPVVLVVEDTRNDNTQTDTWTDCMDDLQFVASIALYSKWAMEQLLSGYRHKSRRSTSNPPTTDLLSVADLIRGAGWVLRLAERQHLTGQLDARHMNLRYPGYAVPRTTRPHELAIQVNVQGIGSFPGLLP